jgi:hypothetical protein
VARAEKAGCEKKLVGTVRITGNCTFEEGAEETTSNFWKVVENVQHGFLIKRGAFSGQESAAFLEQHFMSSIFRSAPAVVLNMAQKRWVAATPTEPVSRLKTRSKSTKCESFPRMAQRYGFLTHFLPPFHHFAK